MHKNPGAVMRPGFFDVWLQEFEAICADKDRNPGRAKATIVALEMGTYSRSWEMDEVGCGDRI